MTSALQMADMVRRGETNAENLVESALDLIEKTDNQLKAWACIDTAGAIASAKLLDEIRDSGRALGPLHGVPIGSDIIDTADIPTEYGILAFKGASTQPRRNNRVEIERGWRGNIGENSYNPVCFYGSLRNAVIQTIWNTVRVDLLRALPPRFQQDMCQWPSEHKRMDR